MKIQCDVCEKATATVICCADEAALCTKCDMEVHAANKLASKHQRLQLQTLSGNLPPCDICQEKTAFIFCVEDRALFCKDCDQPIHSANKRAAAHQRFLATGIRVSLSSGCKQDTHMGTETKPKQMEITSKPSSNLSWAVEDFFSDYGSSDKVGLNELEWLTDIDLFNEQSAAAAASAAEVPQIPAKQLKYYYTPYKKARLEIPDDDEEFLTVPDLG